MTPLQLKDEEIRSLKRKNEMLQSDLRHHIRENISLQNLAKRLKPYPEKYEREFIHGQELKELLADANKNIEDLLKHSQTLNH